MDTTEKGSVIVELYDLAITERKDDRFGRIVITRSLTEDDLINKAVPRRTDLNATTLKASLDILSEIAMEEVINGASVRFGLGYYSLKANGVFIGDSARWDPSLHNFEINMTPTARFRKAIKAISVTIRGMAASGPAVNSVTDVSSGLENSRLTPGGGINITGKRIKIEGDHPEVGLSLINQDTNEIMIIPRTSILINNPSKITFVAPDDLPVGDYKLSICTQFLHSGARPLLKEPRTYIFDNVLNVPV
ncbi:MAG: DNA-binding domain-containing protein [Mangrovibacterium sp.]